MSRLRDLRSAALVAAVIAAIVAALRLLETGAALVALSRTPSSLFQSLPNLVAAVVFPLIPIILFVAVWRNRAPLAFSLAIRRLALIAMVLGTLDALSGFVRWLSLFPSVWLQLQQSGVRSEAERLWYVFRDGAVVAQARAFVPFLGWAGFGLFFLSVFLQPNETVREGPVPEPWFVKTIQLVTISWALVLAFSYWFDIQSLVTTLELRNTVQFLRPQPTTSEALFRSLIRMIDQACYFAAPFAVFRALWKDSAVVFPTLQT